MYNFFYIHSKSGSSNYLWNETNQISISIATLCLGYAQVLVRKIKLRTVCRGNVGLKALVTAISGILLVERHPEVEDSTLALSTRVRHSGVHLVNTAIGIAVVPGCAEVQLVSARTVVRKAVSAEGTSTGKLRSAARSDVNVEVSRISSAVIVGIGPEKIFNIANLNKVAICTERKTRGLPGLDEHWSGVVRHSDGLRMRNFVPTGRVVPGFPSADNGVVAIAIARRNHELVVAVHVIIIHTFVAVIASPVVMRTSSGVFIAVHRFVSRVEGKLRSSSILDSDSGIVRHRVVGIVPGNPRPDDLVVKLRCYVDLELVLLESDGEVAVINGTNSRHDGEILAIALDNRVTRHTSKQRRSRVHHSDGLYDSVAVGRIVFSVPSADEPIQSLSIVDILSFLSVLDIPGLANGLHVLIARFRNLVALDCVIVDGREGRRSDVNNGDHLCVSRGVARAILRNEVAGESSISIIGFNHSLSSVAGVVSGTHTIERIIE